uniref:Uncharacterized protein n=1 Tax=Megaselia scalaris TaxID=36166 RepID=T1GSN5_MEGSC
MTGNPYSEIQLNLDWDCFQCCLMYSSSCNITFSIEMLKRLQFQRRQR